MNLHNRMFHMARRLAQKMTRGLSGPELETALHLFRMAFRAAQAEQLRLMTEP